MEVRKSARGTLSLEIDRASGIVLSVADTWPVDVVSWIALEYDRAYPKETRFTAEETATRLLILGAERGITPRAQELLYDISQGKEPEMARKKQETEAPKEAATAVAEKPKARKKAEPAPAPAADEGAGRQGRPSPYAGKKIKVLRKENPAREGSWTATMIDAAITSKTTDEATEKAGRRVDFKWLIDQGFIEVV